MVSGLYCNVTLPAFRTGSAYTELILIPTVILKYISVTH